MNIDQVIDFLEQMQARFQHGAVLSDTANEIAFRLNPVLRTIKAWKEQGNTVIDVTPDDSNNQVAVIGNAGFNPANMPAPTPPAQWGR